MKKQIVQYLRSTENLESIMETPLMLARKLEMEVVILLVVESRYAYVYPMGSPLKAGLSNVEFEHYSNNQKDMADKRLKKYVELMSSRKDSAPIRYEIVSGITDNVLERKSKEKQVFSIVLNEAQEPEQSFIFNTYLQILRNAGCPILKVPEDYHAAKLKKILYATDYKDEDISTLKKLSTIAAPFDANITALHVVDSIDLDGKMKSSGFESETQKKVGYKGINFSMLKNENIDEGLIDYAMDAEFDMIVVLKENRSFFNRLFNGSTSNKIINQADIPVLLFHEENQK